MDVSRRLAAAAIRRTTVLVAEVPGWAPTRYAAEHAIRERGWRQALSPADADVLLTCGAPGPRMAEALELVWAQLPGPRARVTVTARAAVDAALDQASAALLDADQQRADAAQRPSDPVMGTPAERGSEDSDDSEHSQGSEDETVEGQDDGEDGAEGDDHGPGDMDTDMDTDMDMDSDMDMDMDMDSDMDMEPGGIPLAGGADDRDGLEMDVLHVPLGPVLPAWPAGLLLHCTLSGDVVTEARPEVLGAAEDAVPDPPPPALAAVDRLDRAARLLFLAGWEVAAGRALRLRDDLLAGADGADAAARLDRLAGRVGRSRLLRWALRGAGPIEAETSRELGLEDRATGDVHGRLVTLFSEARAALDGADLPGPVPLDALAALLPGLELGAVRLLVASLDLDTGVRTATGPAAP